MATDNIKGLLIGIFIVIVLLAICVSVDYADEDIIVTANQTNLSVSNCTEIDGVHYDDVIVNRSKNHIHSYNVVSVKPHYPTISMWAKPSCGCRYSYKYWYYREFVNYCPNCKHYNVLLKNPKGTFEKEWTCKRCSGDFCGVCGKEKYSWSRVYLRKP